MIIKSKQLLFFLLSSIWAIFALFSILNSRAPLADLMFQVIIVCVILGLYFPKQGLLIVCISGVYLDGIKRLLIVGGHLYPSDIAKILSFSPVVFVAVCLGIFLVKIQGKELKQGNELIRVSLSLLFVLFVVAIQIRSFGSVMAGLMGGANSFAYIPLLFIAPWLLETTEQRKKFFMILVWASIPTVLVAYRQMIFGYWDYEIEYADAGYTKATIGVGSGSINQLRVYGMMNSFHSYSYLAVIITTYLLHQIFFSRMRYKLVAFTWASITFISIIPGAGRTAWAFICLVLIGFIVYHRKWTTIVFYGVSLLLFVLLIVYIDEISPLLYQVSDKFMSDGNWSQRALDAGTFGDRIISFKNWMFNREYFSLFGLEKERLKSVFVHDQLGQIYVKYGIIGILMAVVLGVLFLSSCHWRLLKTIDLQTRKLCLYLLAVIFSIIYTGIISGSVLHIFPINIYFWLMAGLTADSLIFRWRNETSQRQLKKNGKQADS